MSFKSITRKEYFRALMATLLLVLFLGFMFRQAVFSGRIIAPLDIITQMLSPWHKPGDSIKPHNHYAADAVTQYLPYRIFSEKSLREDGYIGWNPYEMGGYSLAGNTMALPGSWALQLHRFLPFKDAWNIGIIAEFLIAGTGMLAFLRDRRKLPWLPCLIGAIAYTGNSQFIIWIYHRWALGAFCWMPWVLWAAPPESGQAITRRSLLLPVFLGMAVLGGSLQHLAFTLIGCGCMFAGGLRELRKPSGIIRPAALWSAAFVIALLAAAFSVIPQIQGYFDNNSMGHVRGAIGYEGGPSQPLFHALLIPLQSWPWLLGDPQSLDASRLFKCGFMDIAYMGSIPMVLAMAGLFKATMPKQAKWLILAGLLIPLTPLVGPLYHRVQLVFLLGGSWMAAEMIAAAPAMTNWRLNRVMIMLVSALGIALLVGALLPHTVRGGIEQNVVEKAITGAESSFFKPDKEWVRNRALNWVGRFSLFHRRTGTLYLALAAGVAGCLLASRSRERGGHALGQWMILGTTSFEIMVFASIWNCFTEPEILLSHSPQIDNIISKAAGSRVLQRSPNAGFTEIFATPNTLSAKFVKSVDSYESIQYPSALSSLEELPAGKRLTLAGVGIAVHPSNKQAAEGTESWKPIQSSDGYDILKNPEVPPRLAAGTGPLPGSPEDILTKLRSARAVDPEMETMNRWIFTVPDDASWIRVSQNWHIGWKWRAAGGNWHKCTKGADSNCWIENPPPAGTSVEVRFFPFPQWIGWLSLGMVSIWFCGSLFLVRLLPRCCTPEPSVQ